VTSVEERGDVRAATNIGISAQNRRREGSWLSFWGPPLVVFAIFIGIWYLFSYVLLDRDRRFLLPPPQQVIKVSFGDAFVRTELFTALGLTATVAVIGLGIAIVLGVGFSILMSQARWIERSIYPYAVIMQCVPILALVPMIGFWFDYGYISRVIVCVMIAMFPIISNTLFGLKSADQEQHDLFTLRGAGRITRLVKLQIPAASPAIFNGLQVSATLAVIGAIVADFFFQQGDPGIGIRIQLYLNHLQTEQMFAAVMLASAFGVVVFWFFGMITRRVIGGWHGSAGYTRGD
jgi:NitT/TauT family transport system permease protein